MTILQAKEIENRWIKKDKTLSGSELFEVAKFYYSQIDSLPVRERSAIAKHAGFYAIEAFKSGLESKEDLDLARKIVTKAMKLMHSPETFAPKLSKIIKKYLEVAGLDHVEILQSKKYRLQIETGMLYLGDVDFCQDIDYDTKTVVSMIQKAQILSFGLGGDGLISVEIREVSAPEPVLMATEYSKIESSTLSFCLNCISGTLGIGDYFDDRLKEKVLQLKGGVGVYLVSAFVLKSGTIFIALTKSQENKLENEVMDIPYLQ